MTSSPFPIASGHQIAPARAVLRGQVVLLFCFGLVLPLLSVAWIAGTTIPFADGVYESHEYVLPAIGLLETGEYVRAVNGTYTPELVRLPGYPLFIAGVYYVFGAGNNLALAIAQAVLVGLTVAAIGLGAAAIDRSWMWPAALMAGASANIGYRASIVLPEPLFVFEVAGALCALLWAIYGRRTWLPLIVASAFVASAFMTRPAFLAFPFFVAPFLALALWRVKGLRPAAAIIAAVLPAIVSIAVLIPRVLTVHSHTGHYAVTVQGGVHTLLWMYPCLATKGGCGDRAPEALAYAEERQLEELAKLPADIRADRVAVDAVNRALARDLILDLPFTQLVGASVTAFAKLMLHTVVYAHFERAHYEGVYWSQMPGGSLAARLGNFAAAIAARPPMWVWFVAQALLFAARLLQLIGLVAALLDRRHRWTALLLMAAVAAFAAVAVGIGNPRYRVPIEPILAIFAVFGVDAIVRLIHRRRQPSPLAAD